MYFLPLIKGLSDDLKEKRTTYVDRLHRMFVFLYLADG